MYCIYEPGWYIATKQREAKRTESITIKTAVVAWDALDAIQCKVK